MKWTYKKAWSCCAALLAATTCFCQNNPIFKGSAGDGWSTAGYTQTTVSIFAGGAGDGFSNQLYRQATTNIFAGGSGDGWSNASYVQNTTSIFTGGVGDGWSSANYIQTTVNIFTGGAGDGWSQTNYEQTTANIFAGGGGDGWASSYVPYRPLPVTFIYFTAQKQSNNAALVEWKTATEANAAHFEVERSADAANFKFIGKVLASGSTGGTRYSFTDNHPLKGVNYYRLKQVDKDNKTNYTPSRLLKFNEAVAGIVKYYPNPTNGILNIEVGPQMRSETMIINISNAGGAVVNQLKVSAGASSVIQVPLSRYPKGIYFIQVKTPTVNSTQRVVLQ